MKHLSPEQIVDLAEGCADAPLVAHAASCETCRAQVESFRHAVRLPDADRGAEPSPLFWPHLAARIGEAVRREQRPPARWRTWVWRLVPAGATAALVIAVGIGFRTWSGTSGSGPHAPVLTVPASERISAEAIADDDLADDPSWLLVSDLSAEVSVEDADASGALPLPGEVDGALLQLDDAERVELARILREELAPRRPAASQGPGA
jgi:hypothetical protein